MTAKKEHKLMGYNIPLSKEDLEEAIARNSNGDKKLNELSSKILDIQYENLNEEERIEKVRKVIEDSVKEDE